MRLGSLVIVVLALAANGCASEEQPEPVVAGSDVNRAAHISLPEAETALEGELAVVRTGVGTAAEAEAVEGPVLDSARYAARSGGQFSVVVLPTEQRAVAAGAELVTDGHVVRRALNVLLVLDRPPEPGSAQAVARDVFARLSQACAGQSIEGLSELCDGPGGADPGTPGRGTQAEDARAVGEPIWVDGVRYRVTLARKLNPALAADARLLDGATAGQGRDWLGVFIEACNVAARRMEMSAQLVLSGSRGTQVPREPLRSAGTYKPQVLGPGECAPSSERRSPAGRLAAFSVPQGFLYRQPISLRITGPNGGRGSVLLGL